MPWCPYLIFRGQSCTHNARNSCSGVDSEDQHFGSNVLRTEEAAIVISSSKFRVNVPDHATHQEAILFDHELKDNLRGIYIYIVDKRNMRTDAEN
jgi:hypothetical protein